MRIELDIDEKKLATEIIKEKIKDSDEIEDAINDITNSKGFREVVTKEAYRIFDEFAASDEGEKFLSNKVTEIVSEYCKDYIFDDIDFSNRINAIILEKIMKAFN